MRRLLTVVALTVVALGMLLTAGCGTIFRGTKAEVSIRSTPPCMVTVDHGSTYETPTVLKLKRGDSHTFTFEKEGYKPVTIQVGNSLSGGVLVADIFLGGIIGIVVDLADGAMYNLDQNEVETTLQKESVSLNLPEIAEDEAYVILVDQEQIDAYYETQ